MALRLSAMLAVIAGCSFNTGGPAAIDAAPADDAEGTPDAAEAIDGGCIGFSAAHVPDSCSFGQPGGPLHLNQPGQWQYDTSSGLISRPTGGTFELVRETVDGIPAVWLRELIIDEGATLRATGPTPLFIIADDRMVIDGVIDVSSSRGNQGAGANFADCIVLDGGEDDAGGGGGGGGGGFRGAGSGGGLADMGNNNGAGTGAGGPAGPAVPTPTAIRGGCPGARGGFGELNQSGAGGPGGGAVHLTARNQIDVSGGQLRAGGGGGQGAPDPANAGGGGGGSGGYIGADAPAIVLDDSSIIAANGGAGGGGVGNQGMGDGQNGQNGRDAVEAALGGDGALNGSRGGNGGFRDSLSGGDAGPQPIAGAGGGGGGAGYILVFGTSLPPENGAIISPDAQLLSQ